MANKKDEKQIAVVAYMTPKQRKEFLDFCYKKGATQSGMIKYALGQVGFNTFKS